jgi:hypothetical protein
MRKGFLGLLLLFLVLPAWPQTGTPHGINITFNAPSPVGGSGTVAGYFIYQCSGTCTFTSSWTQVNSVLDISTGYLVPFTGLTPSATYSYAATTVDSAGNQSVFSNIATITLPATFPSNPGPPTGCAALVK